VTGIDLLRLAPFAKAVPKLGFVRMFSYVQYRKIMGCSLLGQNEQQFLAFRTLRIEGALQRVTGKVC
jgi:hypothetical protein